MSSLRRAYYGDPREKRLAALRAAHERRSRKDNARSLVKFVRNRLKSRVFAPMFRGLGLKGLSESRYRRNLRKVRGDARSRRLRGVRRPASQISLR